MIQRRFIVCSIFLFIATLSPSAYAESLQQFSARFWQWRAQEQPFTNDDIPRIDRAAGYKVDWSAAAISKRLRELTQFEHDWHQLAPTSQAAVAEQVDYRLIGSAIARVRWELSVVQDWRRDPAFYVDQTLGSVFVLLLQPPPFAVERQREIVSRMQQIPVTIAVAKDNLTDIRQPFAQTAIDALDRIAERTDEMETALESQLTAENYADLKQATPAALKALTEYRAWIASRLRSARKDTAIGRGNYQWFLQNVALLPYTPEQMLALSRQEWSRSAAFETYQQGRLAGQQAAPVFLSAAAQIDAEVKDEEQVRAFLLKEKILTVPGWMQHYRNQLLPAYLEPLEDLGVTDDLTGPDRLDQNGTSYIHKPSTGLGFFPLSTAHDPRPIIVHEGVPGHYFQLCLGWHNEDPIRRHYYDSSANEGIGFYAEEMMLQAGLFDDNAHTRETIYSFMRLRALRVEVDVKLALGEFTLQQAADYLSTTVPMDKKTALAEAAMFSSTPGQAITYQVGKAQIVQLLSDARRKEGKSFSLLKFHDFVWNNGNVPIALQRWEMLGDASDVPAMTPLPR